MSNIKPVSDLKNFEKIKSKIKLMSLLLEGEISGHEEGWLSIEYVEAKLGVRTTSSS